MHYGEGQTRIEQEERDDLIPFWIESHAELNAAEQKNINKALLSFIAKKLDPKEILTLSFVKRLHEKMFGDVWRWAGQFRRTEKNLGIEQERIMTSLYVLLGDALYWIKHATYPADEIAIRCKHRMVFIHPFSNGNGRHSRIFADILIRSLGRSAFPWGVSMDDARDHYLTALREADRGNYNPLISFARQ